MKVKDIMTKNVITVGPDETVLDVVNILKNNRISGLPVILEGKVVGIVTEADIMEICEKETVGHLYVWELSSKIREELDRALRDIERNASTKVKEIMTKKVETVSPETGISEAARIMSEKHINRLPVVDEKGKLVGIVSRADIIQAIAEFSG
ncbi:MAG: CBS domain-containing protein [Candidatus Hydrothermarchaeota archaeon]